MSLRRIDLRGCTGDLRSALPRPADEQERSSDAVAGILAEVKAGGDSAVRRLTERFDHVSLDDLRVPSSEIQAALERVPSELTAALRVAHDRILAYHAHEAAPVDDFESAGITVRHLTRPVERAGCYAPGGRARYPSTVLMCAVPARVAGVAEVVLCVPPGRTEGSTTPPWPRRPSPGSTRSTGSAAPRPSRPWPSGPSRSRRST